MTEEYKTILSFPDYKVSNFGNVKSFKKDKEGKILKPGISNGYLQVNLCLKGKQKVFNIHYLVYLSFNGQYNGVIDHIDSNRENNRLDNLRVITHRENTSKERTLKTGLPVGVCFDKQTNKYISQIHINGKTVKLGRFETIEEASIAYQERLEKLTK